MKYTLVVLLGVILPAGYAVGDQSLNRGKHLESIDHQWRGQVTLASYNGEEEGRGLGGNQPFHTVPLSNSFELLSNAPEIGSWATPMLRTDTMTATKDLEKAELLALHSAAINNNSVDRGNRSFNEKVEAEVRRLITGHTNTQTRDASELIFVDRIVSKRLSDIRDRPRIIPDNQFGFRRDHATIQQLSRVVFHISGNMAKRKITAMVLLDSEKVFDTVWIEGLIQRLATYSFPNPLIELLMSSAGIRLASGPLIRTNSLELHKQLNIPTIEKFVGQLTDRFILSLLEHPNALTRNTHITSQAKWRPTRRNSVARGSTVIQVLSDQ
ncbi:hypothetical protein AAG570_006948 [Ranatra chinensis]|uniref:Reverse transcriptase domain-containing protein n=1 Tax=Ranatra chinensis TaxID=642074 RepID=A0ABD0YW73_9HEMI